MMRSIMKKRQLFLLLLAAALFSCATADRGAGGEGLSLDQGIARIAQGLEDGLPAGTRVAVVNLESPSAYFSDYVLQELQGVLINNQRLVVVERAGLELLRNEVQFQMSGEVDGETAVNMGKWLGAQFVVAGNLTDLGGRYRFRFNATDVETAAQKVSPAVTVGNDRTIAYMLPAGAAPPPAQVPAKPDPALAAAYFNAGLAHYEAKRYTEAVADFTRALAVKKDDEASLRYRAYSYYLLKNYDGTITDVSRLIQMNPGNAESYYLARSDAYVKKGEYDKAIADCNEVLRVNPDYADAYDSRGVAYSDKGEYDKAIADFNEALRINPNYAETYNNRGVAYGKKGEYDKAVTDFTQALRLNRNLAEAFSNRGFAYAKKGEHDRAIADHDQAIRLNPNIAGAYRSRGDTYYDKGEPDRAIADYSQAIRLDPNDAGVYVNRGNNYAGKGDFARARADWEKALQLDPANAGARYNLERLRGMGY
jgi:tetratricopeptide (TPR) repeat protein